MDHRLIEGLMEAIAPLIKSYVDDRIAKEVTPLHAKLAEYEARGPGKDGKDADLGEVQKLIENEARLQVFDALEARQIEQMIERHVGTAIGKIELPKDGKDGIDGKAVDPADVEVMVELTVEKALAAWPKPENGKDADPVDPAAVANLLVDLMPVPENGKDIDPEVVRSMILEEVAKIEPPAGKDGADGKSVTVDDVLPIMEEMVEKRVAALPVPVDGKDGRDGKDGVGMAGAVLGRGGEFIVTLSDGTTKELGKIVGEDGEPGRDGVDGKDGLGFDDLEVTYDGERTFTFKHSRGDQSKESSFKLPVVLDRGVFRDDKGYEKGDGVTFGGSFWISQKDSPEGKPQDGSRDWRLSVKRGRNGADGKIIPTRPDGPVKL